MLFCVEGRILSPTVLNEVSMTIISEVMVIQTSGSFFNRVIFQRYAGTKNRVFVIPDYYSLWRVKAAIMRRAKLGM